MQHTVCSCMFLVAWANWCERDAKVKRGRYIGEYSSSGLPMPPSGASMSDKVVVRRNASTQRELSLDLAHVMASNYYIPYFSVLALPLILTTEIGNLVSHSILKFQLFLIFFLQNSAPSSFEVVDSEQILNPGLLWSENRGIVDAIFIISMLIRAFQCLNHENSSLNFMRKLAHG